MDKKNLFAELQNGLTALEEKVEKHPIMKWVFIIVLSYIAYVFIPLFIEKKKEGEADEEI